MAEEERGSEPLSPLDRSAQPAMVRLAAATYMDTKKKANARRTKVSPEAEFDSLVAVVSLVDLLDQALGRAPE